MKQPYFASAPGEDEETPATRLYQEHSSAIFAYLRLRTATREEAEDLLLDVFLAALEQGAMLHERGRAAQRAWLRGVAAHKVADHYRRSARRRQVRLEQVAETLYADEALAPEQFTLHQEEDARLRALVQRLSRLQQQVIQLHFVSGLRFSEMADVLGKNEGAVRQLLRRALIWIHVHYTEEEGDPFPYDSHR